MRGPSLPYRPLHGRLVPFQPQSFAHPTPSTHLVLEVVYFDFVKSKHKTTTTTIKPFSPKQVGVG
jgi:hypothetical protein